MNFAAGPGTRVIDWCLSSPANAVIRKREAAERLLWSRDELGATPLGYIWPKVKPLVTSRRWLTLQSYLVRIGAGPIEMSGQRASALTGAHLPGFHPRGLDHTPGHTRLGDQVVSRPHVRVFVILLLAALAVRLAFWLYTGRIWEDALISLTAARNAWEGFGLTHHASEPRVLSFTSSLGEAVLLIGEAVGFLVMRPSEVEELRAHHPDAAKLYEQIEEVKAPREYQPCRWGYCVYNDTDLVILKRTR